MPSSAADLPVGAITRLLMATIGNWAYVLKCKLAVASARRREDPLNSPTQFATWGMPTITRDDGRWQNLATLKPCRYIDATSAHPSSTSRTPFAALRC